MRLLSIILLMSVLIGFQAAAQDVQKAAESALNTLYNLVVEENYTIFGFDSPREIENMELDISFQNYIIRLDQLQEYTPDENAQGLLVGGNSYTYPVIVDQKQVKSSILLVLNGSEYKAVKFGGRNYITTVTEARNNLTETTQLSRESFFSVIIPALNVYCLAYYQNDVLMFTPLHNLDYLDITAGSIMEASVLLEALLPEANAHDGLPR